MALIIATILFAGYVMDVVLGATTGSSILSDVQQMLMLLAAAIAFVTAILKREKEAKHAKQQND